jgi:hypothetical protein
MTLSAPPRAALPVALLALALVAPRARADQVLYVANAAADTVSEVGPGGGAATTFATGFNGPVGLAFDSQGNLYAANRGNLTVSEVGPGGGAATTFATGFSFTAGLAFDSQGNLYVANANAIAGTVSVVGPGGGAATTFATGFNVPEFLAFAPVPVPEPSALMLTGIGAVLGLACSRRRGARGRGAA